MHFRRGVLGVLVLLIVALTGCAVDIGQDPLAPSSTRTISVRQFSSAPGQTLRVIDETQLRTGDLLFSSSIGLTSLGIRFFSASAVSHVALYTGEGHVAEAVGAGVHIITLKEAMAHSDKLFALRMPGLTEKEAKLISQFATDKSGSRYNFSGIAGMAPFMLTSKLCSLTPFSSDFRHQCLATLANVQLAPPERPANNRYFCSEFVTAAYAYAGHPLTSAASGWVSPADLLHMREGDVTSLKPLHRLRYVGHLKKGIYLSARSYFQ
ncbi:hypothetical protein GCM10011513_27770 [Franconibacter daqui]|uniref:YaeF family permuted papain-like enzyme n=1 Tax=Franconibacter daqui TaxID=2047724 RepID=UPI001667FE4F|nr:YaeF family permuted papain-like enzyme [Franconibacter daqui]GGD28723.1 hypothetical protein GCM10011513_27770 [Franconibacter daqui]